MDFRFFLLGGVLVTKGLLKIKLETRERRRCILLSGFSILCQLGQNRLIVLVWI